jgi:hypothetical protein
MPLFFLLAGASTWFALRFRSAKQYVRERFRRLLIPLLFGLLVIIPPQSYLGARTYGNFCGSLPQYYPHFFQIGPGGGLEGYMGGFSPGHLWFILMLVPLSLTALPLCLYLHREPGQQFIAWLATFLARPGMIFVLAIPLAPMSALPDIGGKNPFYYLTLFLYGYVLMADARFAEALDRHKTPALILGLSLLLVLLVISASGTPMPDWLNVTLWLFHRTLITWCLLVAILGFGRKYLNHAGNALKYCSQAAYPVYILHQTVIVVIGFYVVRWTGLAELGTVAKFAFITVTATVATVLIYDLLVKRANPTRFLFGMKPLASTSFYSSMASGSSSSTSRMRGYR